jgi:hypothetical protein
LNELTYHALRSQVCVHALLLHFSSCLLPPAPILTCLSACLFLHHPSLLVVTHGFHLLLLNVRSVRLQGHATSLPPLHYSANCPVHILLSASVTSLPTKTKLHDRNMTQHGCPPRSPLHFTFDHFDHFSATISCLTSPVTSSPSTASGE